MGLRPIWRQRKILGSIYLFDALLHSLHVPELYQLNRKMNIDGNATKSKMVLCDEGNYVAIVEHESDEIKFQEVLCKNG